MASPSPLEVCNRTDQGAERSPLHMTLSHIPPCFLQWEANVDVAEASSGSTTINPRQDRELVAAISAGTYVAGNPVMIAECGGASGSARGAAPTTVPPRIHGSSSDSFLPSLIAGVICPLRLYSPAPLLRAVPLSPTDHDQHGGEREELDSS